jgi:hypothetical protein
MGWISSARMRRRNALTPLTLGPVAWFDAQDSSTLFTDSSETVPSTNGSAAGRWKDKSGNGYDATSGLFGAASPSLDIAGINAHPGVSFSGSHGLVTNNISQSSSVGEMWAVVKLSSFATGIVLETSHNFAANPGSQELASNSGDMAAYFNGNSGFASCQGATNTSANYYRARVEFSQPTDEASLFANGSITSFTTRVTNTNNGGTLTSQPLHIGYRHGGVFFLDGHIGEIILFDRGLSPSEAVALSSYLSAKWGI